MGINVIKKEVSGEQFFAITSGVHGNFKGNFLNQILDSSINGIFCWFFGDMVEVGCEE
jgi:hypothetical protein